AFYTGQIVQRMNVGQSQVIFLDIGYHTYIAKTKTQARAEDTPAGSFQHGKVNGWVAQDKFPAYRAGGIAFEHHVVLDIDTSGCGKSYAVSIVFYNMGYQA